MEHLLQEVLALVTTHGLRGIVLVLFVEEMGVPSPAPGDLLMIFGGLLVAQGSAHLATVLLAEELASVAGSALLYLFSRRAGRPLILQYGRYLGLGPERLAETEARIRGREMTMIVGGRLIPGLRILTVVAAGVTNVSAWKFIPAVAIGAGAYIGTFTALGVLVGPPLLKLLTRVEFPASALWSLAGLVLIIVGLRRLRRTVPGRLTIAPPIVAQLAGGLLSGVSGLLGANAFVAVLEFSYRLAGRPISLGLARPLGELHFLLAWPAFLGTAAALSVVHRQLRQRQMPTALRVTLTAVVPAALTLLLAEPLQDLAGELNRDTSTLIIVATTLIRWSLFSAVVEMIPMPSTVKERLPGGSALPDSRL